MINGDEKRSSTGCTGSPGIQKATQNLIALLNAALNELNRPDEEYYDEDQSDAIGQWVVDLLNTVLFAVHDRTSLARDFGVCGECLEHHPTLRARETPMRQVLSAMGRPTFDVLLESVGTDELARTALSSSGDDDPYCRIAAKLMDLGDNAAIHELENDEADEVAELLREAGATVRIRPSMTMEARP